VSCIGFYVEVYGYRVRPGIPRCERLTQYQVPSPAWKYPCCKKTGRGTYPRRAPPAEFPTPVPRSTALTGRSGCTARATDASAVPIHPHPQDKATPPHHHHRLVEATSPFRRFLPLCCSPFRSKRTSRSLLSPSIRRLAQHFALQSSSCSHRLSHRLTHRRVSNSASPFSKHPFSQRP